MALYHFSVRNVSRGKGQMVVASAAYISGQRIFDSYYNKIHDYTSKSGVIFTEILTPEYVPERLTDRETLWNEVEHVERNNKAQLAYSFDIALQNELTLEENIRLAKEFCQEQFVARGMIVDLAVHEGKAENEEEPDNPHFHVLVPIRPFTEEGIWGNKQRREYILDEDGNRVKDAKGKDMASRRKKPLCSSSNTVPTQRHRIMRLHFSKGGKRNRKLKRGIAPMLSKEGFCKALQMIKEQESIDEQFSKALDLVGNGHFVFGTENKYLLALRDVLKETVNDQYDYIDWWLYEATDDYTVWEADCTMKYCLKEPEALYDFITGTLKPVPVSSGESTSQQE